MVRVREAVRGAAITIDSTSEVLAQANNLLLESNLISTALAAVFDPGSRLMRLAVAGHAAPVLVRDGIARPLLSEGIILAAVPEITFGRL